MAEPLDDRGEAGASAAREWERRHDRREVRIRAQHKHLGGLRFALSSDPQSTTFGEVYALWGKALGKLIRAESPGVTIDVPDLERALGDRAFSSVKSAGRCEDPLMAELEGPPVNEVTLRG